MSENNQVKENKNNKKKYLVILFCLFFFLGIAVVSVNAVQTEKVKKAIDLGNKYLLEANYEQAVIEFEVALKIDKKNVDARIGLARAYVGLKEYEKAIDVLEEGIKLQRTIAKFYLELSGIYISQGDTENAVKTLGEGYSKTQNSDIKNRLDEIKSNIAIEIEKNPIQVGNKTNVKLIQKDNDGKSTKELNADWSVKDSKIGEIDKDDSGKATYKGITKGKDEVIASIGSVKFNKGIEVKDKVLDKIEVTSLSNEVTVGDICEIKAIGYDQLGQEMEINPTWELNNELGQIEKSEGFNVTVKFLRDGEITITASSGDIKGKVNVSIKKKKYKVVTSVSGNGSIEKSPDNSEYIDGTEVTLSAVPQTGWHFTGWTGSLNGGSNPASIIVDGNKEINANFEINTYALTTEVVGEGDIVRSESKDRYNYGTIVKLSAVAKSGYKFDHWEGNANGNSPTIDVNIDSDKRVKAVFVAIDYNLTVNVEGDGTVKQEKLDGNKYKLTAIPEQGAVFLHWEGDVTGNEPSVEIIADKHKAVKAVFSKLLLSVKYTLNVETSGQGEVKRSVTKDSYSKDEVVQLTATPGEGYKFDHWEGDATGSNSAIDVKMDNNKTVKAIFNKLFKVSGNLANSTDSSKVENAIINVRKNKDNRTGDIFKNTNSNSNGYYELALTNGEYTLEVIKQGYTTDYENIVVSESDIVKDFALNPIDNSEYRIVLTWGTEPKDLDSHLITPYGEVNYNNETIYDGNGSMVAKLDTDDTDGEGPETVTIVKTNSQKFTYYVFNFSSRNQSNPGAMYTSNALVKVYKNNELVNTFNVASGSENVSKNYWHVFDIVEGKVVPVNNLQTSAPTY